MTSPYVIQVRKEARALLPWWAGVAVTTTAVAMLARLQVRFPTARHDEDLWIVVVHALGILAVAAVSFGHELTHNTLSALLVQPISRLRVLATKLGVLIPAVVTLGLVGNALFFSRYHVPASAETLIVWGPVVISIGLVPLLTVLTRKPLGGVVFALVVPGVFLLVCERLFSMRDGTPAWSVTWYSTIVASVLGVLALFHRFRRIESAGEGGARTADVVATVRHAAAGSTTAETTRATPRHWTWLLVKKELRLQQLTFAVTALGVLACAAVVGARRLEPNLLRAVLETMAGMHACFIVVLAGAFCIAEERRLGTLTPQLLRPPTAWRQFAAKIVVTAGLAGALALALPLLFKLLGQPVDPFEVDNQVVVPLVLLFCAAVYLSSFTTNGFAALLATFPFLGAAVTVEAIVRWAIWAWFPRDYASDNALWEAIRQTDHYFEFRAMMRQVWTLQEHLPIALVIGGVMLVLHFAFRNHRSLERGARTVARQASTLVLFVVVATIIRFAAFRIAEWWVFQIYS